MMFLWQMTFQLQPLYSFLMVVTNTILVSTNELFSDHVTENYTDVCHVTWLFIIYINGQRACSILSADETEGRWTAFSFPLSHVSEPIEMN